MSNKLFKGNINVTKLMEAVKNGHKSVYKSKSGDLYVNLSIWHNSEPDKFGNIGSLQIETKKEDPKIYIGNFSEPKQNQSNTNAMPTHSNSITNDFINDANNPFI
ncbi:MAG: hypothetical protein ACK528_00370 [Alphaproteobacteria bacterium]|jgi:hypothetical protein